MRNLTYFERLSFLWQKHLEPKPENSPTVVSLFAGGGGSSLGYSMAGYRELCAVEFWKPAYECLFENFSFPVITKDIRTVEPEEILNLTGVKSRELDVLDMSPVCCGFSPAGKQNPDDERNFLFKAAVRILKGLQPRSFIMENVPQMVNLRFRHIFEEVKSSFENAGYCISYKVISAKDFGIPTVRRRIFIVGIRNDLNKKFVFPSDGYPEIPSLHVLENLKEGEYKPLSERYTQYWERAEYGKSVGKQNSAKKVNPLKPSTPILCNSDHFNPYQPRVLSMNEMMAIQGFPQGFKFKSRNQARQIIGNSVCPPLMYELATAIREQVL